MRPTPRLILCAVLLIVVTPLSSEGQARRRGLRVVRGPSAEIGPRIGYDFDADDWSVGGQLRVPARVLETLASGDYYFAGAVDAWQLNLDLALRLGRLSSLYAGGGIGVFHQVTTDVGPNLLVGLHPSARRNSPIRPYAEGRWTFLDGVTPFRIVFGIDLVLGR